MNLTEIYQCFCDQTRLRILHLLTQGPLCVCHFQSLLDESQVKISKHLAYLKDKGLVVAHRHQNWMIYGLPKNRPIELEKNLRCLRDCAQSDPTFKADLRKLKGLHQEVEWIESALHCCGGEGKTPSTASRRTSGKGGRS